jgi:hypothetical protein
MKMERSDTPRRKMNLYLTRFPKKRMNDPVIILQDMNYWKTWLSDLGKLGDFGDKWKIIKKQIIEHMIKLQDQLSTIDYSNSEFSNLEFHTILENMLKMIKNQIYKIKKDNPLYHNDVKFIISMINGIIDNNKNILETLEEENIVSGQLQEDE